MLSPEEIARQLGGAVEGDFGIFSNLLAAIEFKEQMEDCGLPAGNPIQLREQYFTPFLTDLDSACPICGGAIYFDFSNKQWGHALRARFPWYPIKDEEVVVADKPRFMAMIGEFLGAYYKVPEGFTWLQVRNHLEDCHWPTQPCEICARTNYGCPGD